MRRALILPSARRGFLTLTWVNYGGYRVPGQPFGVALAAAHFKFHTAGRGLGEHQRSGDLKRAAEQVGWTGHLESQRPLGLTPRPGIVRAERPERKRPLLPALDAAAGAARSVKDSGLP
jgi:hypothetical protein